MKPLLARRLVQAVPVLLIVVCLAFLLLRLAPGEERFHRAAPGSAGAAAYRAESGMPRGCGGCAAALSVYGLAGSDRFVAAPACGRGRAGAA